MNPAAWWAVPRGSQLKRLAVHQVETKHQGRKKGGDGLALLKVTFSSILQVSPSPYNAG